MNRTSKLFFVPIAFVICVVIFYAYNQKRIPSQATTSPKTSYLSVWATFQTQLIKRGPAPDSDEPLEEIKGEVEIIEYPANGLKLKGMLYKGKSEDKKPKPALIFLHGGNSAYVSAIYACNNFVKAGFSVFMPAFRGENGNPGDYEFVKGEVDDAKAAIQWLAQQPYIDKNEIYVFGHSMGGCIALALSLHKDLPIRFTGACSGVFEKESFAAWASNDKFGVPFDFTNEDECVIRCPVYFLDQMQRPHYLYMGTEDGYEEYNTWIRQLYAGSSTKLIINQVAGDHFSSLKPSINRFFEVIRPNFVNNSQF